MTEIRRRDAPVELFAHVLQVQPEFGQVDGVLVDQARVGQRVHHHVVVVLGIPEEQVGDLPHGLLVEVADNAEVDQADPAVVHDDGVGRMRVGVKKTELHQLPGKGPQADQGDLSGVDAGGPDLIHLVHLDAVDVFHDQHGPGGVVPVDLGDVDLVAVLEIGGELLDGAGLDVHVQLLADGPLEFLDQIDGADDPADLKGLLDLPGEVVHQPDVVPDDPVGARTDDLHGDRLTGAEGGAVDLGHRGRGNGLGFEPGENVLDGPAEFDLPIPPGFADKGWAARCPGDV